MPRLRPIIALAAITVVLVACSSAVTPPPSAGSSAPTQSPSPSCACSPGPGTTPLTVGLGYIPSVQFAPFYLAAQNGSYMAAGLGVVFQNQIDANLVPEVGQGTIDIGLADGTSVIPAVSQGIPIKSVATIYGQFPSIVFAKADGPIKTVADLKGRKIGTPGKYGSSWVMLQALLSSAGLTTSDVTIVEYPDFGQAAALAAGAVDAATGFVNNEPVQLQLQGIKTTIFAVDQVTPLPGPGLIVSTGTIASKRQGIQAFVDATLKAMNEITANPSVGVDAAIKAVPDLAKDRPTQEAILAATIAAWRPPNAAAGAPLTGAVDTAGWQKTITAMQGMNLVPKPVTVADVTDTSFTSGS